MTRVVVVDLDGTIIDVNSFPLWVRYLFVRAIRAGKMQIAIRLSWYVFLRKVAMVYSHARFKERVDRLPVVEDWAADFVIRLEGYVREDVVAAIRMLRPGRVILATAAPSSYAERIRSLGEVTFDEVLCSRFRGSHYIDNSRGQKREAVLRLLRSEGLGQNNFWLLTDHADDLELATQAGGVLLCHPARVTVEVFRAAAIPFETVT